MNKSLTFRDALKTCNVDNVCALLYKRHVAMSIIGEIDNEQKYKVTYQNIISTLLRKRKTRSKMHITIEKFVDVCDESYNEVYLLNPRYEEPPADLKCWGGKNPPKGYYNCNLKKYSKYWGFGDTPWAELVSSKVINNINLTIDELVAEIVWELTFHGYTEKQIHAFYGTLKTLVKEVKSKNKKEKKTKK